MNNTNKHNFFILSTIFCTNSGNKYGYLRGEKSKKEMTIHGFEKKIINFFSKKDILKQQKEKFFNIKKEKLNILIIGRGGGNHDAPNLTDAMILASINNKKNNISLLSIPRDLYVEYPDLEIPDLEAGKINEIYRIYSKKYGSKQKGIEILENKMEEITGEKIDYYINIDFKGFTEIIDIFGGIQITIKEDFIDTKFPDNKLGYKTFFLRKGTRTIDGEVALKYARSRHSTSDFDRSLRQQQILKALKNKIISEGFLSSSRKIKKLYFVFKDYVKTDMNLQTIISLGKIWQKKHKISILSFNLNDSCFYGASSCKKGGLLYLPQREFFEGISVLLPYGADISNISNYKNIKKYTDLIFNYPKMFRNNYEINVFNSLKIDGLAYDIATKIKKYGFNIPKRDSIGNTKKSYKKSVIFYNNINGDSETIKAMKKFLKIKFKKVENPIYSKKKNTKIEIIIGEDYLEIFDF